MFILDLILFILRLIMFVYDIITYPIYSAIQQSWDDRTKQPGGKVCDFLKSQFKGFKYICKTKLLLC